MQTGMDYLTNVSLITSISKYVGRVPDNGSVLYLVCFLSFLNSLIVFDSQNILCTMFINYFTLHSCFSVIVLNFIEENFVFTRRVYFFIIKNKNMFDIFFVELFEE